MKPSVKKIVFWSVGAVGVLALVLVIGIAKLELANEKLELENEQSDFRELVGRDASVQEVDEDGVTDLHIAAANDWAKLAKWLIANGANPNARLKYDEKVVSSTTVERLGINSGSKRQGETPIHFAAFHNAVGVAKVLLANGADVNAIDFSGYTPLHIAAIQNSRIDVAAVLLANGANVNAKNRYGGTPLHHTAFLNAYNVAELLLANGANVNAVNSSGETPLHDAAGGIPSITTARLLLANGAYVNALDINDWTPLDNAKTKTSFTTSSSLEMINLLRQHGGRCNSNC